MDKENIYHGNIILGIVILGFGLLRMFNEKRAISSINPFLIVVSVFFIVMGLIGLKYLKK